MNKKPFAFLLLFVLLFSCTNKDKNIISTPTFSGTYVPASAYEVEEPKLYTNHGIITDSSVIKEVINSLGIFTNNDILNNKNVVQYFYFNTTSMSIDTNPPQVVSLDFESNQKFLLSYTIQGNGPIVTQDGVIQQIGNSIYYLKAVDSSESPSVTGFTYIIPDFTPDFIYYDGLPSNWSVSAYIFLYIIDFDLEVRNRQFVIPYMNVCGKVNNAKVTGFLNIENDVWYSRMLLEKNSDDSIIANLHDGDSVVCQMRYLPLVKQ